MSQPVATSARPPFWRDVRVLSWAFQLTILGAVVALVGWLVSNVRTNSDRLGIPTGFDYLDQPASFSIPGNSFSQSQPVSDAIVVGAMNTIRVAAAAIVFATVLGTLVGVGRLSGNWLVRTAARLYVEAIRNVPLLGLVIFAYLALVLNTLPRVADSWTALNVVVINVRGISVPWITGSATTLLLILVVASVLAWLVARWRNTVFDRTGAPSRSGVWTMPVWVVVVVGGSQLAGIGVTRPVQEGLGVEGGIIMQPEYFALFVALVIYTASHIAEIVRGSIQAVPKGQSEAADSLALSGFQRMWFIVLPQAMRIAVPPIGNQWLNLTKNSSLAFAISYFELTKVTVTSIGNRSPAVPSFLLLMAVYLVFSLVLSLFINLANRRLELVTR